MTTEIKYLAFKGVDKKEQILFKSFLNLAKNELEYQVVILKQDHQDEPNILIVDEGYEFADTDSHHQGLPTITVGESLDSEIATYIQRPVQWSDFKLALSRLDNQFLDRSQDDLERTSTSDIKFAINKGEGLDDETLSLDADSEESFLEPDDLIQEQVENLEVVKADEPELKVEDLDLTLEEPSEQVSADELNLEAEKDAEAGLESIELNLEKPAPVASDEVTTGERSTVSVDSETTSDDQEGEFELDQMTVEYNSFTSSEYLEDAADDVSDFNKTAEPVAEAEEPVILVTDSESSSVNSVLVFETDSEEAWEFSVTESTISSKAEKVGNLAVDDDEIAKDEVVLEKKVGLQMKPNEKYWETDNEIIANHQTLFYIKTQREMVYSAKEPGHWPAILREGSLSKLPLSESWTPKSGFKAYPINCLTWVNVLVNESDKLADDIDEDASFLLKEWPQFDLIELDNSLLKLCTMLFVRPETLDSLITKSGYSRSTVTGLINACDRIGILESKQEGFEQSRSISILGDDGVLGKLKGVFR